VSAASTTTALAALAAVRARRDGGTAALWLAGRYYLHRAAHQAQRLRAQLEA